MCCIVSENMMKRYIVAWVLRGCCVGSARRCVLSGVLRYELRGVWHGAGDVLCVVCCVMPAWCGVMSHLFLLRPQSLRVKQVPTLLFNPSHLYN